MFRTDFRLVWVDLPLNLSIQFLHIVCYIFWLPSPFHSYFISFLSLSFTSSVYWPRDTSLKLVSGNIQSMRGTNTEHQMISHAGPKVSTYDSVRYPVKFQFLEKSSRILVHVIKTNQDVMEGKPQNPHLASISKSATENSRPSSTVVNVKFYVHPLFASCLRSFSKLSVSNKFDCFAKYETQVESTYCYSCTHSS